MDENENVSLEVHRGKTAYHKIFHKKNSASQNEQIFHAHVLGRT